MIQLWPDRKMYDDLQSSSMDRFSTTTNMGSLMDSIGEGIKVQEQNRRKRVMGSYECEVNGKSPCLSGNVFEFFWIANQE